jgi:hypothetical protein
MIIKKVSKAELFYFSTLKEEKMNQLSTPMGHVFRWGVASGSVNT